MGALVYSTDPLMLNILIVEDDPDVANFIRNILRRSKSVNIADTANGFEEGFSKGLSNVFDVILIDISLGQGEPDGIELCRAIRKNNTTVSIIMVTVCHAIPYLEAAFAAGADDYITKPFRPKELELRVKRWALLRHKIEYRPNLEYQDLSYDSERSVFFYRGEKLRLTRKQKTLLLLFLAQPGRVLSAHYLGEKFWGDYADTEHGRNIRSNIHLLRHALSMLQDVRIKTVWGEGYLLELPEKLSLGKISGKA